jgi:hypothetical protein
MEGPDPAHHCGRGFRRRGRDRDLLLPVRDNAGRGLRAAHDELRIDEGMPHDSADRAWREATRVWASSARPRYGDRSLAARCQPQGRASASADLAASVAQRFASRDISRQVNSST